MEFKAGLWTAVFLFVLQLTHISAKNIPTYFRPGGTLSLSPTAVPDPVRSVLWTHNGNLVAEWIKDEIELQYYGVFRNRTELNTTTGQLRITQTTEADNGEFSVELNNVIQADRYEARMIQEVPDPYVWVRPNKDLYVLYCDPVPGQEAALQAAEPVSYWWKIGTADWAEFGNKLEVNDNETTRRAETFTCKMTTRRAETFTCKMVNPVSEKTSQPVQNPLNGQAPSTGTAVAVGVGVTLFLGLLAVFLAVYAYIKKKFPFNRTGNAPVSSGADEIETGKLKPSPEAETGPT